MRTGQFWAKISNFLGKLEKKLNETVSFFDEGGRRPGQLLDAASRVLLEQSLELLGSAGRAQPPPRRRHAGKTKKKEKNRLKINH